MRRALAVLALAVILPSCTLSSVANKRATAGYLAGRIDGVQEALEKTDPKRSDAGIQRSLLSIKQVTWGMAFLKLTGKSYAPGTIAEALGK